MSISNLFQNHTVEAGVAFSSGASQSFHCPASSFRTSYQFVSSRWVLLRSQIYVFITIVFRCLVFSLCFLFLLFVLSPCFLFVLFVLSRCFLFLLLVFSRYFPIFPINPFFVSRLSVLHTPFYILSLVAVFFVRLTITIVQFIWNSAL